MLVIFCVYTILYLIQFLYLNIADLFTFVDLARAIDHYNLQAIDSSELLILSNGWTLDMEHLSNILIWNGFQCQFHKFHDFNAVFFIYEIIVRLSKCLKTEVFLWNSLRGFIYFITFDDLTSYFLRSVRHILVMSFFIYLYK